MEIKLFNKNKGQWITASALLLGTIAVLNMEPLTVTAQDTYTVQPGDNIYQIAQQYGVTEADIQAWNGMGDSTFIDIGDVLYVYGDWAGSFDMSTPTQTFGNVYTVMPGDNLYRIAVENGTTEDYLMAINGLSSNLLQIGQQIVLGGEATGTAVRPVAPNEPVADNVYVVVAGDNLYDIGLAYGVTEDELMAWNGLATNLLQIGDRLVVSGEAVTTPVEPTKSSESVAPTASKETNVYIVQPGDNLYRIAVDNGTTEEHLLAINGLDSNLLQIGQQIILSGEAVATPTETAEPTTPATPDPTTPATPTTPETPATDELKWPMVHIVVEGDNTFRIAEQYEIEEEDLFEWNGMIEGDVIYPGDELIVSNPHIKPTIHKVARGETLASIAETYKTSSENVIEWNKLSGTIPIGTQLFVSDPNPETHQVEPGQTLTQIAELYNVTIDEIREWNKLPDTTLIVNGVLIVSDPTGMSGENTEQTTETPANTTEQTDTTNETTETPVEDSMESTETSDTAE